MQKVQRVLFFVLIFLQIASLHGFETSFVSQETAFEKANSLFNATAYEKAATIYRELLWEAEVENYPQDTIVDLTNRLANSLFLLERYREVIDLLENYPKNSEGHFILGLAYKKILAYEKSIVNLSISLNESNFQYIDEAIWELGLIHFNLGHVPLAHDCFRSLVQSKQVFYQEGAHLYLFRLNLYEGKVTLNDFIEIENRLLKESPWRYELSFLKGEFLFQQGDFFSALATFPDALPKNHPEWSPWYQETVCRLALSHLKLVENYPLNEIEVKEQLMRAEHLLFKLLNKRQDNADVLLALSRVYFSCSKYFDNIIYLEKARTYLAKINHDFSYAAQAQALLLRAEMAPSYQEREELYQALVQEENKTTLFYAQGWYLRGLNHFNEIQKLTNEEAQLLIGKADACFYKAYQSLQAFDSHLATEAFRKSVAVRLLQNNPQALLHMFNELQEREKESLKLEKNEYVYLASAIMSKLVILDLDQYQLIAEAFYKEQLALYPDSLSDALRYFLGTLYFRQKKCEMALEQFELILQMEHSPYVPESLFWSAHCYDVLKNKDKAFEYRKKLYEEHSFSTLAPEAYFLCYTFHDYLQGDRKAIKHLDAFPKKFPESTHAILAWYLIGMDLKRDRKTLEGKWIRKKNLSAAVDAFHNAELLFKQLKSRNQLIGDKSAYYQKAYHRSILERAFANVEIADESEGAKRQIYLDYAEEVLKLLIVESPVVPFDEEALHALAQVLMKSGKDAEAEATLRSLIKKYEMGTITRGYFLSRTWYDLSLLAFKKGEYHEALKDLEHAEDAAKGKVLNTDQRLDLWIQQSHCYRALRLYDDALLLLSQVVNDNAVSSLRIKAMFLRSEVYEEQGRLELARRQLESLTKNGGEWSVKAKVKLEEKYGY